MCFQDREALTRDSEDVSAALIHFIYSQCYSRAKHLTTGTSETGPCCSPRVCSGSSRSLGPTALV